jgi:hypothetical protein
MKNGRLVFGQKVGPHLWLKLDRPYRVIKQPHIQREYAKAYKKLGTFLDARGGWDASRMILQSGFCFWVSDRPYTTHMSKKKRVGMREVRRRKREQAASKTPT